MTSARCSRASSSRRATASGRRRAASGFGSAESSARANAPFQGPIRRVPEAPRRVDRFAGVLGANSGRGGVAVIPPERAPGGDAAGRPTGPWRCDSLAGSAPIGAVSASSSTRGRRMVFRWCFVAARRDLRRGEARGRTVREDSRGVATRRARGRGTRISRLGQREIRGAPLARRARTSPCVLRDARGVCSSPFRRPRRAWPRLHRARARSGVQSNARDPTNARSFSAPL